MQISRRVKLDWKSLNDILSEEQKRSCKKFTHKFRKKSITVRDGPVFDQYMGASLLRRRSLARHAIFPPQ